jgi:hypothetical protein
MNTGTKTATRTHSRTATRTGLLRLQLEVAARRLASDADRVITKMIRPGLAEGFLGRLDFYALDANGASHARLSLGVDWEEHRGLVATSATVRVPAGWVDRVAPEVHVAIEFFQEVVEESGAKVKVYLIPAPDADRAQLAERFGLNACKRPAWAAEPTPGPLPVPELPELHVELEAIRPNG